MLYLLVFLYSVRSVMHKYLEKEQEVNFDKIFNQVLGKFSCHSFLL